MRQFPDRWHPVLLVAMMVSCVALAQENEQEAEATSSDRPRIGLVLGGGGARGAAHIGVLRELERQRIPIDAIAGTSMGAAVGGLYASGMSVDELEKLVADIDWADVLSDTPPRRDLDFRRKQDDERYPINFELGVGDGRLRLPLGLIQGQKLDLVLRELTLDVSHIDDFDDLPVPFRAVASDIERGEIHVMGSGDLALAIRASMSVPGAFAPVQVDGRMLVDGGLVGNLPVEVVREMDVDVIIAVDVEFPLYGIEELQSAISVSEQILTILIRRETQRQIESLAARDVLIRPDLGKFGSTEFTRIVATIEPGAAATRGASAELRSLALTEEEYAAWRAGRFDVEPLDTELAFVRVTSNSRIRPSVLASNLDVEAGDPIDGDALQEGAERLYGTRLFEKVDYRLVEEGGRTGVEYRAMEQPWGPSWLRFGIALSDDFEGATNVDLRARLTRPAINDWGGEWRSDLQVGTSPALSTELYQPLRFDSRFFVSPRLAFEQSNLALFEMEDVIARLRISELTASIDAGIEVGNAGELRLGAYRGTGGSRTIVGDPAIPAPDFETGGVRVLLRLDTFDDAWFPRRGYRADIEWKQSLTSFGADDNHDTIDSRFEIYRSRGKTTLGLGLEYATTLSFDGSVQDLFRLGGFRNLSGFESGAVTGPHAALARLSVRRRIGDSAGSLFEAPVYLGATLEAGNAWQTQSAMSMDSLLTHGSLFLGMDSFLGPVFLAAGFGEVGRSNFYLYIGAAPH